MSAKEFFKWNRILGWVVFSIALITYGLCVEPTASFWDAGEYISTSANLAVGHPPGAPLFQMLGAFFAMFAFGNTSNIAIMVNMLSAVSSAFAILFLFWTISMIARKLVVKNIKELNKNKAIAVLGSALVGALAFTFTDTFWFNAVETEVYAMATFIMSLLFWLGLKWEEDMHKPRGNKWLVIIAFVIGLSFGIHFMGLLTIPAIGLIYFFKNYKTVTVKNFIIANVVAIAILLFIFKMLLPNALSFFGWMEVSLVNGLGLPFHSGTIIALIILIATFYYVLNYTRKNGYVNANTLTLCVLFIFIGFSSWTMLPIRANAGTTINENNPSNARELLAYYSLEQYGSNPFLYGPQFTDQFAGVNENDPFQDVKPKYEQDKKMGKYVIVNNYKNAKYNSNPDHLTILPRMWSPYHAERYLDFMSIEVSVKSKFFGNKELRQIVSEFNNDVKNGIVTGEEQLSFIKKFSEYLNVKKPSLLENFKYMFQYQLGDMYARYFLWNFVGKQDDIQWKMSNNGNWISGINFIDSILLGISQDNLPKDINENKGRNTYFFLPFILGLIGFLFVIKKDLKLFWVLLVFFLFTGLAIQVYTNVRPFEPRERDYSVVGSFYVFAIWIGIGVLSLYEGLKKYITPKVTAPLVTVVCLLAVPFLLANQNWDDHDRSGKYTAQSMAKAYLDSCQENAILFTIGDNDTFALWYLQEIEGYRRDVRVINTSLLGTAWYIDQMKKKAYESDPIPSQLSHSQYRYGTRDQIIYQEKTKDTITVKELVKYIASDKKEKKYEDYNSGQNYNTFPTKNIRVPVDKDAVLKNNIVPQKNTGEIVSDMYFNINNNQIGKSNLLMLDMLANNNWERPIYFSGGSNDPAEFIWLKDYLQYDGIVYKLVPIHSPIDNDNPFDMGFIDTDSSYQKIMAWDWGNSGSDAIYHDVETRRNAFSYRASIARVSEKLIDEKKFDKAEDLMDLAMEKMPVDKFELYSLVEPFVEGYYRINKSEKARKVFNDLAYMYKDHLNYYSTLSLEEQVRIPEDIITDLERLKTIIITGIENKDTTIIKKEIPYYLNALKPFKPFLNNVQYGISLDRFVEGLYKAGLKNEARELFLSETQKVSRNLKSASKLNEEQMYGFAEQILTDINDYKKLLRIVHKNDDSIFFNKEKQKFDENLDKLESLLMPGEEENISNTIQEQLLK